MRVWPSPQWPEHAPLPAQGQDVMSCPRRATGINSGQAIGVDGQPHEEDVITFTDERIEREQDTIPYSTGAHESGCEKHYLLQCRCK